MQPILIFAGFNRYILYIKEIQHFYRIHKFCITTVIYLQIYRSKDLYSWALFFMHKVLRSHQTVPLQFAGFVLILKTLPFLSLDTFQNILFMCHLPKWNSPNFTLTTHCSCSLLISQNVDEGGCLPSLCEIMVALIKCIHSLQVAS